MNKGRGKSIGFGLFSPFEKMFLSIDFSAICSAFASFCVVFLPLPKGGDLRLPRFSRSERTGNIRFFPLLSAFQGLFSLLGSGRQGVGYRVSGWARRVNPTL